ncbi:MAG TPA: hypothetical protein VGI05_17355 [Streptosporangiaceae bacterium]
MLVRRVLLLHVVLARQLYTVGRIRREMLGPDGEPEHLADHLVSLYHP